MSGGGRLRVVILASSWTGYNDAAARALAALDVDLLTCFADSEPNTSYHSSTVEDFAEVLAWREKPGDGEVAARVAAFAPDAVLMHSWHYGPYREAIKGVPPGTLRVLWMDNVWRRTAKQVVGRAVAPVWVRALFDAAMVPSDRTEVFARMLGFGEEAVIRGSLSADTGLFSGEPRSGDDLAAAARFVACLRLVHHKGADVLAEAYRRYRDLVDEPWGLRVVGEGPLRSSLESVDGVELPGFLQPFDVAAELRAASCLVNPSREEPFGVVLHEAAATALPIISTYFVGAAPLYVQDGQNGWVVPRSDAEALARAMARLSGSTPDRLGEMSRVSHGLGSRMTSEGWARNLREQLDWRLADLRG